MSTPQPPFYRTRRFYLVVIVIAVVIAVPTITYYDLSYNSVNGTHPELFSVYRSANNFTATFYITVHVWSWAGSLDTQVNSPAFTLSANNLPFGTQTQTLTTFDAFSPNNYDIYSLTFTTNNAGVAANIRSSNTTNLFLQMSADVSAGWYGLITRTDSATWIFTG